MKKDATPQQAGTLTSEAHAPVQKSGAREILTVAQAVKWIGDVRGWDSCATDRLMYFVDNEPVVSLAFSLMCVMIPHCEEMFAQQPNSTWTAVSSVHPFPRENTILDAMACQT